MGYILFLYKVRKTSNVEITEYKVKDSRLVNFYNLLIFFPNV